MTRTGIRLARLVRPRRFRYRRLHVLHLDMAVVLVVFGVGWLLFPSLAPRQASSSSVGRPSRAMMMVSNGVGVDELAVASPAVFAWTTPYGFADGVVADQLERMGRHTPPPPPASLFNGVGESFPRRLSTVADGAHPLRALSLPAVPIGVSFPSTATRISERRVDASIPGLVGLETFSRLFPGEEPVFARVFVAFGQDRRATAAIVYSPTLPAGLSGRIEQAAMRLVGPPGAQAWIVLTR